MVSRRAASKLTRMAVGRRGLAAGWRLQPFATCLMSKGSGRGTPRIEATKWYQHAFTVSLPWKGAISSSQLSRVGDYIPV